MINVNDFKSGQTINYDGNLYMVLEFNHVKPGKGAAIVKAKLKNLRTGSIAEYTFNAGIKVPTAHVEKQKMQFLYSDGDTYSFMNMETYEQVELNKKQIENEVQYLKEGLDLIEEVQLTGDIFFPKGWLVNSIGKYSSADALKIVTDFLVENPKFSPILKRKLLQATDNLFRAQEIKKKSE